MAKKIWRMFSELLPIVWEKRRKRRTRPHFPATDRYSSFLDVLTEATVQSKSTSESCPK